jgi:glutathione gamma-glutamylcysteinyltransferase
MHPIHHPPPNPQNAQAACLAKCNGANVTLHRAGSFSLEQFRADVVDTCTSGEEHLVVR